MGKTQAIMMAAMTGLLLQGCIEESTVIKVKRDGSGIIHERSYSAPAKKDPKLPDEAALREYAATLGKGVTFKSVKASTNRKGWKGYEIVYEFDDINTVRYARKTPGPESGDEDEGENEESKKQETGKTFVATFAMEGGALSINLDREAFKRAEEPPVPVQLPDSPTIDPFADTKGVSPVSVDIKSPFANEAMLKTMTKGMRLGLFVQVEGEIAETNAAHQQGNLITLFSADLGKVFEGEGALETVNRMNDVDRVEFQRLADGVDGLDIDLQDPIKVTFK